MRPLVFTKRFQVSLELYSEGWIGWIGNPAHDSLEALGAHLLGKLATALEGSRLPWGTNLIHSPAEPRMEAAVTDLYLRRGVARVSASAFMELAPSVVRFAASGLHTDGSGRIRRKRSP